MSSKSLVPCDTDRSPDEVSAAADPNTHEFYEESPDDMNKMIFDEERSDEYSLGIESQLPDLDGNFPNNRQRSPAVAKYPTFVPDSVDLDDYMGHVHRLSRKSSTGLRSNTMQLRNTVGTIHGSGRSAHGKRHYDVSKRAGTDNTYSLLMDLALAQHSLETAEKRATEALCREEAARKHASGLEAENACLRGLLADAKQDLAATTSLLAKIGNLANEHPNLQMK